MNKIYIEVEAFKSLDDDSIRFAIDIELEGLIDGYAYHDAPSAVTWYANLDQMNKVKSIIENAITEYWVLKSKEK